MYEGTLGGSGVCIKRVRAYKSDPEKATKVCYRYHRLAYLPSLTKTRRYSAERL